MVLAVYFGYSVVMLMLYSSASAYGPTDLGKVARAPWRHMAWLCALYSAGFFLAGPGLALVSSFVGVDLSEYGKEWTEGVQIHPDNIMSAGAVLGCMEWICFAFNKADVTSVDSVTGALASVTGVSVLKMVSVQTDVSAKLAARIFKRMPGLPAMVWGWLLQHYNRQQRTVDPNAFFKSIAYHEALAIALVGALGAAGALQMSL